MKIGIVGGGINGLCCAWTLTEAGHDVQLFERGGVVEETSRASSKLLHGGLRYLENFEFRLVREALQERDGWLDRSPGLTKPLRLVIPIYKDSRRGRWPVLAGLTLYRLLAGNSRHGLFRWLDADALGANDPHLVQDGLIGGYQFLDGQMDDYRLGLWVADKVRAAGGQIAEHTEVTNVSADGSLRTADGQTHQFDAVINVAGPWAESLSSNSGQELPFQLDLVRGSHLIVDRPCPQAYLLEAKGQRRVFFVLPWQGKTMIGTTEVRQVLDEPVRCSDDEQRYLLDCYNAYSTQPLQQADVESTFAGVRPLIMSANDPNKATREYALHVNDRLLTVLGGKWTTALALSRQVSRQLTKVAG